MKILREVAIAPTCLVSELILWVALGRPPEWMYSDADGDFRTDTRSFEVGGIDVLEAGYSREEFEAIGAETNYEKYESVFYFADVPDGAPEHLKLDSVQLFDFAEAQGLTLAEMFHDREIARNEFVQQEEKQFDWHIERAKLAVFHKVFNGSISTQGAIENLDEDDYAELEALNEIPVRRWSIDGFDFRSSSLIAGDETFRMVQVDTERAVELFRTPFLEPEATTADKFGSYFVISETSTKTEMKPKRRGRPKKSISDIEAIVLKEFSNRLRDGRLPEKREAIVSEALEWCHDVLMAEVSRTVAQRYLKPVFAKMPKKAAQK